MRKMLTVCSALANHGERVSATGAWILPKSFKYHTDHGLSSALVSFMHRHRLQTVVDIGAGRGAYVAALNASGYEVDAIDGAENIAQLSGGRVRTHDLTTPLTPCVPFDLAISLEVAEHIPKQFEATYLDNLQCSCRRFLIISWAPPGQFGSGHVNTLKSAHVQSKMKYRGFEYRNNDTQVLRHESSFGWFRRNLLVFERQN